MIVIKSINGVQLATQPLTDGYSVTCSDLLSSNSGRTAETGKALRYPIRDNVFKLTLKFKGASADIASVDNLVKAFTQTVVFYYGGQYVTKQMYPSDRTINDKGMIAELSVNLIEI